MINLSNFEQELLILRREREGGRVQDAVEIIKISPEIEGPMNINGGINFYEGNYSRGRIWNSFVPFDSGYAQSAA